MTILEHIHAGIAHLGLGSTDPYNYVDDQIFRGGASTDLAPIILDTHFQVALGTCGVWNKVKQSRESLFREADQRDVASKIELLSRLYAAFVYPRDAVMGALIQALPADSKEREICTYYFGDAFRHIRNSIAHGAVDFLDDDKLRFNDRDWEGDFCAKRLLLDTYVVTFIFMRLYEEINLKVR